MEHWEHHRPGSVRVCDGKHDTERGCSGIAEAETLGVGREVAVKRARLMAAAPDLLQAACLAALNFKRSDASGNFLGDDDHEAWTALNAAIAKAERGVD